MGDLANLLERVEKAKGPDRALDGHIYGTLGFQIIQRWGGFEWRPEGKGIWRTMPELTASLDAALALVERLLPGWSWTGGRIDNPKVGEPVCWAVVYPIGRPGVAGSSETASRPKTPALALLAALLRALIAQEAAATPPSEPASAGPCSPAPPIHQDESNRD